MSSKCWFILEYPVYIHIYIFTYMFKNITWRSNAQKANIVFNEIICFSAGENCLGKNGGKLEDMLGKIKGV